MAISRSQMERQLREKGGIITLEDAKRMAPPGEDLAYINKDEAALLKSLGGAGEDINGTGIKSYFLKKVFRKAKKAVKKVVKSPVGKAAILGALTFGIPGTQFSGFAGGKGLAGLKGKLFGLGGRDAFMGAGPTKGLFGKLGLTKGGGSLGLTGLGKIAGITGLSGLAGLAAAGATEDEEDEIDLSKLDRGEGLNILDIVARARKNDPEFRFLPGAEFTDAYAAEGGRIGKQEGGEIDKSKMIKDMLDRGADDDLIKSITKASQEEIDSVKNNQAEGKAEGGLMNLGGMEMDLRGGGFVPLGAKEKADDVPARLSKNEFVMTCSARCITNTSCNISRKWCWIFSTIYYSSTTSGSRCRYNYRWHRWSNRSTHSSTNSSIYITISTAGY
jgi:hypothetical protein